MEKKLTFDEKIFNAKQHFYNLLTSKKTKTDNENDLIYFLKKDKKLKKSKTESVVDPKDLFQAKLDLYLLLNKKCMNSVTYNEEDIMYIMLRDYRFQNHLDTIFS